MNLPLPRLIDSRRVAISNHNHHFGQTHNLTWSVDDSLMLRPEVKSKAQRLIVRCWETGLSRIRCKGFSGLRRLLAHNGSGWMVIQCGKPNNKPSPESHANRLYKPSPNGRFFVGLRNHDQPVDADGLTDFCSLSFRYQVPKPFASTVFTVMGIKTVTAWARPSVQINLITTSRCDVTVNYGIGIGGKVRKMTELINSYINSVLWINFGGQIPFSKIPRIAHIFANTWQTCFSIFCLLETWWVSTSVHNHWSPRLAIFTDPRSHL